MPSRGAFHSIEVGTFRLFSMAEIAAFVRGLSAQVRSRRVAA